MIILLPPTSTLFPYTTLFRSIMTHYPKEIGLGVEITRQEAWTTRDRSEEHTSELQSRENLVCRLLLEKKKGMWGVRRCWITAPDRITGLAWRRQSLAFHGVAV